MWTCLDKLKKKKKEERRKIFMETIECEKLEEALGSGVCELMTLL